MGFRWCNLFALFNFFFCFFSFLFHSSFFLVLALFILTLIPFHSFPVFVLINVKNGEVSTLKLVYLYERVTLDFVSKTLQNSTINITLVWVYMFCVCYFFFYSLLLHFPFFLVFKWFTFCVFLSSYFICSTIHSTFFNDVAESRILSVCFVLMVFITKKFVFFFSISLSEKRLLLKKKSQSNSLIAIQSLHYMQLEG